MMNLSVNYAKKSDMKEFIALNVDINANTAEKMRILNTDLIFSVILF